MPHLAIFKEGVAREVSGTTHAHEGENDAKGDQSLTHEQAVKMARAKYPGLTLYEIADKLGDECKNLGLGVFSIATIVGEETSY